MNNPPHFVKYVSVVLELSIRKMLEYGVTSEQAQSLKRGMLVEVPVRGSLRKGYIFAIKEHSDFPRVLPIARIISDREMITEELFELALWMAKYYHTSLGQVFKAFLPGSIRRQIQPKQQLFVTRRKTREHLREAAAEMRLTHPAQADVLDVMLTVTKGILLTELLEKTGGSRAPVDSLEKKGYLILQLVRVGASPLANQEYFQTKPKRVNHEQAVALQKIFQSLEEKRFEAHLLYGVTGSGKTEVYLQAIQYALERGYSSLMLVPEISLTAQTVERFKSRFPDKIAILHHRLSEGERFEEWHKIRTGEAKIIIGARSAIFSPAVNLGLIIVDEEHEHSYKQSDEAPPYHARDVAVMRAHLLKATIVLGSATPSLESFYNHEQNKYKLSVLSERAESASLPKVTLIDMRSEREKTGGGYTLFSNQLLDGIKRRYEQGEQSILFLNRRGYHTTYLCQSCGYVAKCTHCDVSLTFHWNEKILSCHLCGFSLSPPLECPSCRSPETLKYRGIGTEQVERVLHAIFPTVRTLRIDADTTRHKGSHDRLLREFRTGKADVLIGTQMIAKGLHFPSVTLVAVLNSDSSLNIPDFRASETAFQLLTQVAGRSGRGVVKGEVMIQTHLMDNQTIQLAAAQDYLKFYREELEVRRFFGYPPFAHMVKFTFTGEDSQKTFEMAQLFYHKLMEKLPSVYVLNSIVPSGHAKVKDRYRFQFCVRGPSIYFLNEQIEHVQQEVVLSSGISLFIDVDPTSTFF